MISNGENWHYLVVKRLPGLLKGITSNHNEDFYCLNCVQSYRTKNKLEAYKKKKKNTSKINEEFIKNYDENNDKGYVVEVDVKYPKKLHDIRSDLPFLPKRMKIDKCKKLVCNLLNKKIRCAYKIIKTRSLNHYGIRYIKTKNLFAFD